MKGRTKTAGYAIAVMALLCCASCQRETRDFHPQAPEVEAVQLTKLTDYQPGEKIDAPEQISADLVGKPPGKYEENAYALNEGKRLYVQFNCYGCHAHGGGDMGPPLMDDRWIYGARPEQVFSSIVAGRPNGMPAFGAKIPAFEVWQLAAYVRSMSGQVASDAAPGRDDDMKSSPPENSAESTKPVNSPTTPPETSK
jgi:cytochrome c oxidase cbb3-type subunit III